MINKDSITDLFFDLDHTLWDFETNSQHTFASILAPYAFPFTIEKFMEAYTPINHAFWKLYRENKISTLELRLSRLEKTFETLGAPQTPAVLQSLSDAYIDQLSTHTHLFEGTIELLDYLKTNYRLHIITNGFEQVQQKKMDNSGIAHYFDVVLTAERAGVKKPHSAIFEKALEEAGVEAKNSLMIGDSYEADIAGAVALGMQAIHFNSHHEATHKACPMVESLAEIREYL